MDPDAITKLRERNVDEEMENSLKEYIHKLRLNAGIVNTMILISTAHGTVEYYNRSLLKKYGGCLELSRAWAKSLMSLGWD